MVKHKKGKQGLQVDLACDTVETSAKRSQTSKKRCMRNMYAPGAGPHPCAALVQGSGDAPNADTPLQVAHIFRQPRSERRSHVRSSAQLSSVSGIQ